MKKILAVSICLVGLLLATSCSDPNEDVFHEIDNDAQGLETVGGNDNGGAHESPPPGGN